MNRAILLLLLLLAFVGQALAMPEKETHIAVVLSENSKSYRAVWDSLLLNLRDFQNLHLQKFSAKETSSIDMSTYHLFVTVGTDASQAVLKRDPQQPVIMALMTRSASNALLASLPKKPAGRVTSLVLDQPGARLLSLSKALLPEARNLGGLHAQASKETADFMHYNASRYGLVFTPYSLNSSYRHAQQIEQVLEENNVYIALPDAAVMTPNTAKWLLYMAYQQQVPVLAFSRAYVRAGALAAVYTSPEQQGRQTAELVLKALRGEVLPKVVAPRYFRVATNSSVAKSLGVPLQEESVLYERVKKLEQLAYE